MTIRTLTKKELKQVAGGKAKDGIIFGDRKPGATARDGIIFGD